MKNKLRTLSLAVLIMLFTQVIHSDIIIDTRSGKNKLSKAIPIKFTNKVDREKFFKYCQKEKEFIKLTKGNAKKNINLFFDYWEKSSYTDKRWIAYILASVYRETKGTMMPVREGGASNNEEAIKRVAKLVRERNLINEKNGKKLMVDYSIPDAKGNSYYGRGFVQLTGKNNYKKIGQKIGVGNLLVEQPDKALDLEIAIKIAVEGSVEGWFTKNKKTKQPNKLSDFFNSTTEDWILARNIINPGTTLERKKIPAEVAKKFYSYLN